MSKKNDKRTRDEGGIGIVSPETLSFEEPLDLACGRTLSRYDLVMETYGALNSDKSNALLILTPIFEQISGKPVVVQFGMNTPLPMTK